MRRCDLRELEVLLNRQTGNDPAVFGHKLQPGAGRFPVRHLVERLVIKPDLALLEHRIARPRNRPQGRRLTRPVAAEQRQDLALANIEADALNDVALAVVRVNVMGREEGRGAADILDRLGCRSVAAPLIVSEQGHRCAPPR